MAFHRSNCETCEIRNVCRDDESLDFVMQYVSYRDRAVITEGEFFDALTTEQADAVKVCERAQYVLKTCGFSEVQ